MRLGPATPSLVGPSPPAPSRTAGSLWRIIRADEAHGGDRLDSNWLNNLHRRQDRHFQAQRFGCRGRIENSLAPGIRLITRLCVGPRWPEARARLARISLSPQARRFLLQLLVEPQLCAGLP